MWIIRTPGGSYRASVRFFGPRMADDEATQNRSIWFFASRRLKDLDPEAVQGARALQAQLSGPGEFFQPEKMDRFRAEQLARQLEWAVTSGQVRFEQARVSAAPAPPQEAIEKEAESVASTVPAQGHAFIEVVLVDDAGSPVGNEAYELKLPNGEVVSGLTDHHGKVWAPPMRRGSCELTFPNLDKGAWAPG